MDNHNKTGAQPSVTDPNATSHGPEMDGDAKVKESTAPGPDSNPHGTEQKAAK